MALTLHSYFRSSASFRVRIAMDLKGIAHERAYHHLRKKEHQTPEYLALNPQGLVPALETDEGVLNQSLAIIEYLEELYPEPPLLPKDPAGRARVRALALTVACDIHPLNNLRVLRYLRHDLGQGEESVAAWYNHWLGEGFAALEKALCASAMTGRFCHGDQPTLADVCLVPQAVNAKTFSLDMGPFPTIRRILDACLALPAFERSLPSNQPDAVDF